MQRYFAEQKEKEYVFLSSKDFHHIKNVMRLHEGDFIEVVYQQIPYLCCLENVNDIVKAKIVKELPLKKDSKEICLILPFLKEQKMDFILQKATEMGISEFLFVPMERSIVKLEEERLIKKRKRWEMIVKEASEQSKRSDLPKISFISSMNDLKKIEGVKFLCSTREFANTIKKAFQNLSNCDKISIVIGPEGGIAPLEEEKLEEMGFIPISLGSLILRVESVPIYLLSIIQYECME